MMTLQQIRKGRQYSSIPNFNGNTFFEPADGGNIHTSFSTFTGGVVDIVARYHKCTDVYGGSDIGHWRNILFAVSGVNGQTPLFNLEWQPTSTGRGAQGGTANAAQTSLVWCYDITNPVWNQFDTYVRQTTPSVAQKASNNTPFNQDYVFVAINEMYPMTKFMDYVQNRWFPHPWTAPSAYANSAYVLGIQKGGTSTTAYNRTIPDMPLYGFTIAKPGATLTKTLFLTNGQHPYEGQNKMALKSIVDTLLFNPTESHAATILNNFKILVYPVLNPTGEMAGLWRSNAAAQPLDSSPGIDLNRNWDTTQTNETFTSNYGLLPAIIMKKSIPVDLGATGLNVTTNTGLHMDFHQNYGDAGGGVGNYINAISNASSNAWISRVNAYSAAAMTLNAGTPSSGLLRWWLGLQFSASVLQSFTVERSVYNTLADETAFGLAVLKGVADMYTNGEI